jgi:hypothetical protein
MKSKRSLSKPVTQKVTVPPSVTAGLPEEIKRALKGLSAARLLNTADWFDMMAGAKEISAGQLNHHGSIPDVARMHLAFAQLKRHWAQAIRLSVAHSNDFAAPVSLSPESQN